MIINGVLVSYKFGPKYDMDIRFSKPFQALAGCTFEQCNDYTKLVLQLLCHAVMQIQYTIDSKDSSSKKQIRRWTLEKVEEIEDWEYPIPGPGETIEAVIRKGPILVKHPLTYAEFHLKEDGRLVLKLRESYECDYLIDHFDPEVNSWIDSVLDFAEKHCDRFGRRE